jgi:sugar lactone lactonase YvrE
MRPKSPASSILTLHLLWMAFLLTTLTILLLSGCGVGRLVPPSAQPGAALHGGVHGGQQPVAGANVYLLAANTSFYAGPGIGPSNNNASISLLTTYDGYGDIGGYVTTAADGSFNITGDYTCTPGQQVYLYVLGGNSGGGTNSYLGLMAILGNCPAAGNLDSIPYVEVNEVSTVAAAYAFAGYATDSSHVSTNGSPQALTGIANAFATASNLVDLGSGVALATTPANNGTVPTQTINTLANILASCVNSADDTVSDFPLTAPSVSCQQLLSANYSGGEYGYYANNTADAAIYMAHNPSHNVPYLYALPSDKPPFGNALTAQPNDFTLSIPFTGAGITSPVATAIDSSGNVWVADANNTLDALSNLGAPLSGSPFTDSSISDPQYIAVDPSNNIWITNAASNSVTRFTNAGAFSGYATYAYGPAGLSIDASGNAWIPNADSYNSGVLTKVSPSGTATSVLTGLNYPQHSVIDSSGNLWFDSINSVGATKVSLSNSTTSGPFAAGAMTSAGSLAIDSSGNLWGLQSNGSLNGIDSSGNALSGPPYNTSGNGLADALVLDGQNNFWLATGALSFSSFPPIATSFLTGVSSSGSALLTTMVPVPPSTGPFPTPNAVNGMAIDSSGNIWIPAGNQVLEYIGIATPIETPVAQAVADHCIAQLPCLPPI